MPTFPLVPLWHDVLLLVVKPDTWLDFVTFPELVGVFGAFALLWIFRRRFSPGLSLYLGAVLLASLTLAWYGEPKTISTLRYLFGTFPAAQLLALWSVEHLSSRRALVYAGAGGLTVFALHSYLFGLKDFLG